MPFVSFSSQHVIENSTAVPNLFINNYLPVCNGDCARVYLYGLSLCSSASRFDNTLSHFAQTLNLSADDVISAYTYWQDQGLVQILALDPIEIKYLPIKHGGTRIKKYTLDKYASFNAQIQEILDGRMITPTEFSEYYTFLESQNVEPAALLLTAKHCANLKGSNVGYAYILTVARNWALSNIKTADAVKEKLGSESADLAKVSAVLKALNQKRTPEPADFELYAKWTKKMGFSDEVILSVAKTRGQDSPRSAAAKSYTPEKLDSLLLKYFELKLFEISEIKNYQTKKQDLIALAYEINKKIGVYYENIENVVETYIVNWQLRGYDRETLLEIASFCFKSGIRTLEGMDSLVSKFYKQGITSSAAIDDFIAAKISEDKEIKAVLEKINVTRQPNQTDRDFYNTWTRVWNFSPDLIDHAAALASEKGASMQYINKILSNWREQKVTTLAAARKTAYAPASTRPVQRHSYSESDLNRLFVNLDDVKFD